MGKNELAMKNGTQRISEDPLACCIVDLINAMQADFGIKFRTQFAEESENLRNYKRRLYARLRGHELLAIQRAYERYIDLEPRPEWPPTIPEFLECLDAVERKIRIAKRNQEEIERIDSLPPPKIIECNPIQMLRDAIANAKPKTLEQRLKELDEHNELLRKYSSKIYSHHESLAHLCVYQGCSNTGTMSHGTRGEGNFYCSEHFRKTT